MSSSAFGWETLLDTDAPAECSIRAALFTTYDRADEAFLAEHLLPLLLKVSHEPGGEGPERQLFLVELDERLKALHDRIVVVSSSVRDEVGESGAEVESSTPYAWIWRSIRHLTVGRRGKAVQHAKLSVLHWTSDEDATEYVELVVSSTNLTGAAYRHQLQAGWRACIALYPSRSETRLKRWGVLPAFIRELAHSAGDVSRVSAFIDLLARADCPNGVTFVASVPGVHSRQVLRRTPWGAAGLRTVAPAGRGVASVSVLTPFVGSWDAARLKRWSSNFYSRPDRIELIWIDKQHPWAKRWILPKSSVASLQEAGARILQLRHATDDPEETDLFHDEHRHADDRWCHAKLYSFRRGRSQRLLVTSANFSAAAWGRADASGGLTIENFELGVCLEQAGWPFADLAPCADLKNLATVATLPRRSNTQITWAQAIWTGKYVDIECRCEPSAGLSGFVTGAAEPIEIARWTDSNGIRSARVSWASQRRPPQSVQLTSGDEGLVVSVFDARPSKEREETAPTEVEEDVLEILRDELLFAQYGGVVAADDLDRAEDASNPSADDPDPVTAFDHFERVSVGDEAELMPPQDDETDDESVSASDSYAVPSFTLARRYLEIVDNWASHLARAVERNAGEFERGILKRDGERLIAALERRHERHEREEPGRGIGASLAAEELTVRLRYVGRM